MREADRIVANLGVHRQLLVRNVALDTKIPRAARKAAAEILADSPPTPAYVRINALDTTFCFGDIEASVAKATSSVVLFFIVQPFDFLSERRQSAERFHARIVQVVDQVPLMRILGPSRAI